MKIALPWKAMHPLPRTAWFGIMWHFVLFVEMMFVGALVDRAWVFFLLIPATLFIMQPLTRLRRGMKLKADSYQFYNAGRFMFFASYATAGLAGMIYKMPNETTALVELTSDYYQTAGMALAAGAIGAVLGLVMVMNSLENKLSATEGDIHA